MSPQELETWMLESYQGLVVANAYRERSFFFNPDGSLPKGIYFATIKESDGPNDKASQLDREEVFRLSTGIGKEQYRKLFGDPPPRPGKGKVVNLDFHFPALGVLMPHPVYAWLGWVCINSPTGQNMELVRHLLDLSYQQVLMKFAKRS